MMKYLSILFLLALPSAAATIQLQPLYQDPSTGIVYNKAGKPVSIVVASGGTLTVSPGGTLHVTGSSMQGVAGVDLNGLFGGLGMNTTGINAAGLTREVYLAARTDGLAGTGVKTDPINVSTATLFDNFFQTQFGVIGGATWTTSTNVVSFSIAGTAARLQAMVPAGGKLYVGNTYNWIGGNGANYVTAFNTTANTITLATTPNTPGTNTTISISTVSASNAGAYAYSNLPYDGAVFHFAPGNYTTYNGIFALSGWKFEGSGQGATVITGTPITSTGTQNANITIDSSLYSTIYTNGPAGDIYIHDLTIDGGTLATGAPLTTTCSVAASGSFTASVGNVTHLVVGQAVYIQDSVANSSGIKTIWGTATITAISGSSSPYTVTMTAGTTTAGTAPTTCYVLPAFSSNGIAIESYGNVRVENCTIQDVEEPNYEGPVDICISSVNVASVDNAIRHNLVTNTFGACGIHDWAFSNNNYLSNTTGTWSAGALTMTVAANTGMTVGQQIFGFGIPINDTITSISGTTIGFGPQVATVAGSSYVVGFGAPNYMQCEIADNTIYGDGYYQGLGPTGTWYSSIHDNHLFNTTGIIYSDTGVNAYDNFYGNTAVTNGSSNYALYLGIGTAPGSTYQGWYNSKFYKNNFNISTGNWGIGVFQAAWNCNFDDNTVTGGAAGGNGINISTATGATGNTATFNTVSSLLTGTVGSLFSGTQMGNHDEKGNMLDLGLTNLGAPTTLTVSASGGPYKTVAAAVTKANAMIATSGGPSSVSINVTDGAFTDKNLAPSTGVSINLFPGITWTVTSASANDAIFKGAGSFGVYGAGQTLSITSTTGAVQAAYILSGSGYPTFSNVNLTAVGVSTSATAPNYSCGILCNSSVGFYAPNCNISCTDSGTGGQAEGIVMENSSAGAVATGSGTVFFSDTGSSTSMGGIGDTGGAGASTLNWTGTIKGTTTGGNLFSCLQSSHMAFNFTGSLITTGSSGTNFAISMQSGAPASYVTATITASGMAINNGSTNPLHLNGSYTEASASSGYVILSGDPTAFTSTASPSTSVTLAGGMHNQWQTWTGSPSSTMALIFQPDTNTRIDEDVAITSAAATTITPALSGSTFYPSSIALTAGQTAHFHKLAALTWAVK